ncbi:type VI secretion system lipoprotein TssJ [Luteibacter sp.]|jgi:type VI secretion system protein VasD|uniref:type VI secretion system lipoprotein TssJ n=1 Tax=Luteibacter sp. TaxID=1886636 RepID=UPI002F42B837
MTSFRRFAFAAALVAASLAMAGCRGGFFHRRPAQLRLDVAPGPHLNADEMGRPYALRVAVIQLKDRKPFDDASYDVLAHDTASLGDAVTDAIELTLVPGAAAAVDRPLHPDTRSVGIVAFYHHPEDGWRTIVDRDALPARRALQLRVDCGQVWVTEGGRRR